MELLYQNDYGAVYKIDPSPIPDCDMQLVVDGVGLFMTTADLEHLLQMVLESHEPKYCADCGGPCQKIWCTHPLVDICLKVDAPTLRLMEDLIRGTLFMLNLDSTLAPYRLKKQDRQA